MRKKHFLLVEDDIDLVTLTLRIFEKNQILTHLNVAMSGQEAIRLLNEMANEKESLPSLVMLDLNMPKMGGKETLKSIRNHPKIKSVPVVILTTSQEPEDVALCYELGANGYVVKPTAYQALEKTLLLIEAYWGGYNVPPPICPNECNLQVEM